MRLGFYTAYSIADGAAWFYSAFRVVAYSVLTSRSFSSQFAGRVVAFY